MKRGATTPLPRSGPNGANGGYRTGHRLIVADDDNAIVFDPQNDMKWDRAIGRLGIDAEKSSNGPTTFLDENGNGRRLSRVTSFHCHG